MTIKGLPPQDTAAVSAAPATPVNTTCTARADSSCAVFFDGAPSTIVVKVSWGSNAESFTVQPVYMINQPNGPNCEPTCHYALITLTV